MGRGLSQRRRVSNFNKAKQAKSGTIALPPPPDEVERSRKRQKVGQGPNKQLPASFRKLMAIKGVADSQSGRNKSDSPTLNAKARKNKFRVEVWKREKEQHQVQAKHEEFFDSGEAVLKGGDELEGSGDPVDAAAVSRDRRQEVEGQEKRQRNKGLDKPVGNPLELLYTRKALKQSKKDFLKGKKMKQKKRAFVKAGTDDDSDHDLEAEIMTDRHKPAFGEQALQPIKLNLKRKHWAGSASEKAKDRMKEIFQRQLKKAEAQAEAQKKEVEKVRLAEAFRKVKRQQKGDRASVATQATLAALVKRNTGPAKEK